MISKVLAAGALAAAALSACSTSTGGTSGTATSRLAEALDSVHPPATNGADEIQYSDIARERDLGIIDPAALTDRSKRLLNPQWNRVAVYGAGVFAQDAAVLPGLIDVDVLRADTAITVGTAPNSVTRISGDLDATTVKARLQGLGAKSRTFDGVAGLTFAADDAIDRASPFVRYGIVNQLDQVVVTGAAFSAAANSTALERSVGGGTTMLYSGSYRAVTECLGDVIAADISVSGKPGNSALVAVGERDPGSLSSAPHEVVCLLPRTGRSDQVKTALTKSLALTAVDPSDNLPLSSRATAARIDDSGPLVRAVLTLRTGYPTGYVFEALARDTTRFWDGTCTAADLRKRTC